jgi:hypothetical protein
MYVCIYISNIYVSNVVGADRNIRNQSRPGVADVRPCSSPLWTASNAESIPPQPQGKWRKTKRTE